ncbi:polysaccharide deacetylase family protein [Hephaestia sp. GCM10023244]|uniref:polysaccharide deacetylase family protein n=1 Tax=unclassified Hephaestia TaxID=2631281 RepID=UPI00207727B8|nr:polysaccharide deacetylase family protein [Hephaestia sp. MAHUQ-44]MCM8730153.1 polysaccharide deacetylase family protein [Hephaestia sp. MAHUQ-44]
MSGDAAAGQAEHAARIAWPDDFGTRFTLFVDTEEEFDWRAPLSRDARATTAITALPDRHRRFADRAIPVAYLIDHPVATSARAIEILRGIVAEGGATIGTQLHPWVNPPFDEALTPANSYPGNLPVAIEAAKLDILTAAITTAFGTRPLVYRAGRYGIGPATAALLAERGYRLDSSMRSRYDYRGDGGPDFGAVGNEAFWLDAARGVIELPLTTVFTGIGRRGGEGLYRRLGTIPRGRGVAARLGVLARVALTPEDMPVADALEAIRVALGEGVRVLNFAFHSPSLVPGHTPYVRDAADLAAFHGWWDRVLDLLDRLGATPIAAEALIAAADATGAPTPASVLASAPPVA